MDNYVDKNGVIWFIDSSAGKGNWQAGPTVEAYGIKALRKAVAATDRTMLIEQIEQYVDNYGRAGKTSGDGLWVWVLILAAFVFERGNRR